MHRDTHLIASIQPFAARHPNAGARRVLFTVRVRANVEACPNRANFLLATYERPVQ